MGYMGYIGIGIVLVVGVLLAINLSPSSVPTGSFFIAKYGGTFPIYKSVIVNYTISAGANQVTAEISASNLDLQETGKAFSILLLNYYFNDCKVISASMISPNGTKSNISVVYATDLLVTKNIFIAGGGCTYDIGLNSEQLISSEINYR